MLIVDWTAELSSRALDPYRSRPDKEWGRVDCAAFVVMTGTRITEALTPDEHFQQAGFEAMTREQ